MSEIDHEAALRDAHKLIECSKWMVDHGFSPWEGTSIARAYLDLDAQLAAERARVEALCDVIYDANGIAYPFAEMQDKMTAILNAQGDEA